MIKSYQINKAVTNVIDKLHGIVTAKGTVNDTFLNYQVIFNSMSRRDRRFIIENIMISRGRFIKKGVEDRVDVHLEGLGTFRYKADREEFLTKYKTTINEMGYTGKNIPEPVKFEVLESINRNMDKQRLDNYFGKLQANKDKKFKPTPIFLNLNIKNKSK
jgi:hypothetical protein